ncbi:TPA: ROK family protein, partial [Enterococcus faecium]|nr:ROK family protein [Enterococcus faecium]
MLYGGIEAGGTKFVCGIGNEQLQVIERKSFPTTTPEETMEQVFDFFDKYKGNIASIGVGAFGPIDIQIESRTYGYITNTPKLAWQNYHFVGALENALSVPIYWTTDVNAACYGEYMAGYGKGKNSVLYYTVGTGVGGGAVVDGKIVAGFSHPEMGHMLLQRHNEDQFEGICPFHHDCLEGLASGPAIEKRFGRKAQTISFDHPYWTIEADYLAQ